ncbi:NADPH-dependent FMN reductase [Roseovarius aestuariivivens]|uniref:NADPH-dependent FMN reductase n=1 Tax=Roseovarius aestuariivivens TaxID=1888910 RepID=UPI001081C09D|nr:NADPH-dependent FMN reductase [Roseovarius aestuariivivens]
MSNPKLLLITGSLREGSFNRMLVREAARMFGPADVTEADLNLPLYNGDVETSEGVPEKAKTLAAQVAEADALIVGSPEYNKGITGVLKNALDWASRVDMPAFKGKPTVLLSASAGRTGGETALFMAQHCLSQFQVRFILGQGVMVAAASNHFDENGSLTTDTYRELLQTRMDELRAELG